MAAGRLSRTLEHHCDRRHAGAPAARATQTARCPGAGVRRKPAPRHRVGDGLRDRAGQSTRRTNCRRGCAGAYLRNVAGQRLERARHSGVGVSTARPVSRQVVCDDHLALDRDARRARALSRRGTASAPRTARLPSRRRALGVRDQSCRGSANPAHARARYAAGNDLANDVSRHVLERRATTGARYR